MTTSAAASARPPAASDQDAIAAVLAGDPGAFAVLVQRHNQALFRACRAVLGNDAEAEDAVQAAWVSAYRALASFRAESTFRTWVTRIAVHEASSRLRRRARLSEVPLEGITMTATVSPERDAFSAELGALLERHIDALPEGMRTVLVLRDIIELDTAETAACVGIAEEAVRVRLHRARRALAESISSELVDRAAPAVWRFDGERCARVLAGVMAAIGATEGGGAR
ncbi:MAG TPA: RNA polymerase sigma factor [Kofleriaceae bacterium]|nr:RNA polymerase sigma factor [Kofleriaceae bacterium]